MAAFIGDARRAVVVKADTTVGGSGVWRLLPSMDPDDVVEALRQPPRASKDGLKANATPIGPYFVEEWIAPGVTLPSPSLDVLVLGAEVRLVGIALQLLRDGTAYSGSTDATTIDDSVQHALADLAMLVAEHLRLSGYRGLLNIDVVFDEEWKPFVVEINLRQSAPLDQSLRQRVGGADRWMFIERVSSESVATLRRSSGASRIVVEGWQDDGEKVEGQSVYFAGNLTSVAAADAWRLISDLALDENA